MCRARANVVSGNEEGRLRSTLIFFLFGVGKNAYLTSLVARILRYRKVRWRAKKEIRTLSSCSILVHAWATAYPYWVGIELGKKNEIKLIKLYTVLASVRGLSSLSSKAPEGRTNSDLGSRACVPYTSPTRKKRTSAQFSPLYAGSEEMLPIRLSSASNVSGASLCQRSKVSLGSGEASPRRLAFTMWASYFEVFQKRVLT